MRFVVEAVSAGDDLIDPRAGPLRQVAGRCQGRAEVDVGAFLAMDAVFPPPLAAAPRFRAAVEAAYDDLVSGGVDRLLARLSAAG
jgi:mannitol-1-phosphate/altronate dehydrogenase